MRAASAALAIATALFASQAQAAVVVTLGGSAAAGGGLFSSVAGAQTIDFDTVTALTGITYSSSKGSLFTTSGNLGGRYKSPVGDTSQYLSVGSYGGETVTIDLAAPNTYFGLFWGTTDAYNRITFLRDGSEVASFTGTAISPTMIDAFVNFSFTGVDAYDRILLSSGTPAFESDNHAFAAAVIPLPAALPAFVSGMAALAWLSRRRRT